MGYSTKHLQIDRSIFSYGTLAMNYFAYLIFFLRQVRRIGRRGNKITALSKLSHDAAFTWWPSDLSCRFKSDSFWEILLSEQIWTVLLLEELLLKCLWEPRETNLSLTWMIHTVEVELIVRCFCWFLAAMLVPIRMGINVASPYKAL